MPAALYDWMIETRYQLLQMKLEMYQVYEHIHNAGVWLGNDQHVAAGQELKNAAADLYEFTFHISDGTDNFRYALHKTFAWINDNWPEGNGPAEEYELTAEKICEAWAADDFGGRMITIAFIDRMRQLLWDEPYYVKWAARPEA